MWLWSKSWSQISAFGVISDLCPMYCWGDHAIIERQRSSQRWLEANMRRLCAKPFGRGEYECNPFSNGRRTSAVYVLSLCYERSSSSLHAQGVNAVFSPWQTIHIAQQTPQEGAWTGGFKRAAPGVCVQLVSVCTFLVFHRLAFKVDCALSVYLIIWMPNHLGAVETCAGWLTNSVQHNLLCDVHLMQIYCTCFRQKAFIPAIIIPKVI